jgi:hypothetical protein
MTFLAQNILPVYAEKNYRTIGLKKNASFTYAENWANSLKIMTTCNNIEPVGG